MEVSQTPKTRRVYNWTLTHKRVQVGCKEMPITRSVENSKNLRCVQERRQTRQKQLQAFVHVEHPK